MPSGVRRFVGQLPHALDAQALLRGKEQPEQQRRADRDQVQHDRGADRRLVRRAVERRRPDPKRLVKAAHRAGRRHRDADHQQRNQQERPGERHGEPKRHRHRPDAQAIDSHSGNDQSSALRQPCRPPNRAQTTRELLGERRDQPGQPGRQRPAQAAHRLRASRAGSPATARTTHEGGERADAAHAPRPLGRAQMPAADSRPRSRPNTKTIRASRTTHRHDVEQALEDDRRERAGRVDRARSSPARLPRQKIRADDLAGARRQHGARRKPDSGRPNVLANESAERLEQESPAQRSNRKIRERQRERQHQPVRPRVGDAASTLRRFDVVTGTARRARRQPPGRAMARRLESHHGLSCHYYTAPTSLRADWHLPLRQSSDRQISCQRSRTGKI